VSNVSKDTSDVSKCVEDCLCQIVPYLRVFAFLYSGRVCGQSTQYQNYSTGGDAKNARHKNGGKEKTGKKILLSVVLQCRTDITFVLNLY